MRDRLAVPAAFLGLLFLPGFAGLAQSAAASEPALQPVGTVRVTVARANVRLQPTTESAVITTVSAGTVLELIERDGDWYNVLLPTEAGEPPRTGYIFGNLVEVLSSPQPAERTETETPATTTDETESPPVAPAEQAGRAAELADPEPETETVPAEGAPGLQLPQQSSLQKPAGFDEWNERLNAARAKRANGVKLIAAGGAAVVLSSLLSATTATGRDLYITATMVGIGALGFGGWTWYSANQEIDDLDREGRINGYLTLSPLPGGVMATAALSF